MAESTRVDTSLDLAGAEPSKYFNGKQWFSAKRGEWIGGNIHFQYFIIYNWDQFIFTILINGTFIVLEA